MPIILPETGTIELASFERFVTPAAMSAPFQAIEEAVRKAAIEFCRRTLIWAEHLPDMVTVADQEAYELDRPDDSVVFKLTRACLAGRELRLVPYSQGLAARQNLDFGTEADTAYLDTINQIHLAPTPTVDDLVIYTDAVLIPTDDAPTLPGLLAPFREDISFGALARLLMLKESDAYDPTLAQFNSRLFTDRIQAASVRVARGMSSAPIRSRRDPRSKFI